jgi:uncharacterized protein (TIGR02145 family)
MYKMKNISISVSIVFLTGCSLFPSPKIEVEVDPRVIEVQEDVFVCGRDKAKDADGNEYKTAYFDVDGGHDVTKEGQCWMTENLNVGTVILNPDQEPSDDGVIEKWCMTDDWSADFLYECDIDKRTPRLEICQDRYARRHEKKQQSDSNFCDGTNGKTKSGGLYSWQEAIKYNLNDKKGICPVGWEIPLDDDWATLVINLEGNAQERAISVAEYLKNDEIFNGLRVGTLWLYNDERYFMDRGQKVIYLAFPQKVEGGYAGILFRTLFSRGHQKRLFEGDMAPFTFNVKMDDLMGRTFSIRCIKKQRGR